MAERIQDFLNFILKYINDGNPAVACASIRILNKVLASSSLKKQFNVKGLIPLLVKKYGESGREVREEATKTLKMLLKVIIVVIRRYLE